MGADLHRHAAGDLRHRLEQGQRAVARGYRLISDAGRARLHQALGLREHGIGIGIGQYGRARRDIIRILEIDALASAGLDHHLMTCVH